MSSAAQLTDHELALVAELEDMEASYRDACRAAVEDMDAEIAKARAYISSCTAARTEALKKVNSEYIEKVVEAGARHAVGDHADRIVEAARKVAGTLGGAVHDSCSFLPDVARVYLVDEAEKDARREALFMEPGVTRWRWMAR